MRGKLLSSLLVAAAMAVMPNVAHALILNVTSGDVGLANLCADPICSTQPLTFDDGGALSGTITLDGGNLSFDLTASVIGFSGGPDGSVSDLELQTVHYQAGPVAIVGTPDDFTASGTALVGGTVVPDVGGSAPLAIAAAPWTASCQDDAGQLKCGIVFAGFPLFSVQVDGQTRYVPHTLNPTAVPEPAASVMALTAALAGLAYGRRKVRS